MMYQYFRKLELGV